jgi:hypothetical protein
MSFPNSPQFSHPTSTIGTLTIDDGIDQCAWAYNLNTAVFPTYGGEVVQILSVYIDDVTIGGTVSTYSQSEAIYSYFARYMQLATQGFNQVPNPPAGSAYNTIPITFTYPARNWSFQIFPKTAPGFEYSFDMVSPTWQITAHVYDNSVNLKPIKNAITSSLASQLSEFEGLNDEISPDSGDPDTDPFQTFSGNVATGLQSSANYYNSLISAYSSGNFDSLTGGVASSPSKTTATKKAINKTVQKVDKATSTLGKLRVF